MSESPRPVHFADISALEKRRPREQPYLEFLRVPSMSAGVYVLAAGAADKQSPHHQDEMYYVIRGKARMRTGAEDRIIEDRAVQEGSVIFVAAEVEHRFYDIEQELTVLVFFAPAEG